jgi:NarL family two-component system response regulator LiaR
VLLVEDSLRDVDVADVLSDAKALERRVAVIVIAHVGSPLAARRCLDRGASGFLGRAGLDRDHLVRAIVDASLGYRVVSPEVATAILCVGDGAATCGIPPLTERESEVWRLVAAGLTNNDIADVLEIAERTVKFHVSNILSKLGADNRTQAAAIAHETGYYEDPVA